MMINYHSYYCSDCGDGGGGGWLACLEKASLSPQNVVFFHFQNRCGTTTMCAACSRTSLPMARSRTEGIHGIRYLMVSFNPES